MVISSTGLVYLVGFLSLSLLVFRFYQYWRREKTITSKVFFLFVAIFDLFFLITATGGILFAQNPQALRAVVISSVFVQSSAASVLGYLLPFLKFPKFSPWIGFGLVFFSGIVATFIVAFTTGNPYFQANGAIEWGLNPFNETLRSLIFLSTILPTGIILVFQGRKLENKESKSRAVGLGWLFLAGVVTGILDFLLENFLHLGNASSDISVLVLAISILFLVFFTQRPEAKWVKKVYE